MIFRDINHTKLKNFLNKALIYAIIAYAFFILGRSIWTNFQLKRQIDSIKQEITSLEKQNQDLENLILYYQSDSFKEVEARAKLGLKKPGETVVSVPTKTYNNYQEETAADKESFSDQSNDSQSANWENWWNFFTK